MGGRLIYRIDLYTGKYGSYFLVLVSVSKLLMSFVFFVFFLLLILTGIPCITDCVMGELEKLGRKFWVALKYVLCTVTYSLYLQGVV